MGKAKKRPIITSSPEAKAEGLEVGSVKKFKRECGRAVNQVLGRSDLAFNIQPARQGEVVYALTGVGQTSAKAERTYPVVPYLFLGEKSYWLAVRLELSYVSGGRTLSGVAVLVFEGSAGDEEKVPLIRAEWAHWDESTSAQHAQPHWHVYQSVLDERIRQPSAGFQTESEMREFVPGQTESPKSEVMNKFHFAMGARWHDMDGGESHKQSLKVAGVQKWLEGCLTYTLGQLRFLHSKM